MTSVVQTVASGALSGATTVPLTLASTGAGHGLVFTAAISGISTSYTAFTFSVGTWTLAKAQNGNGRYNYVYYSNNVPTGTTSITATPTGGSGGLEGGVVIQELNGTLSVDQAIGVGVPTASPVTITASAVNTGTTDFVIAVFSTGNGANPAGITDPPTGYTSAAVLQNDSSNNAFEACYRINSSAVTDSVTWSCSTVASPDPAILVSFQVSSGLSVSLTGQALTAALGSLAVARAAGITGQSLAAALGLLKPARGLAVTGAALAGSLGAVTSVAGVTVTLNGLSVTGALGSLAVARAAGITGQSLAAALGLLVPARGLAVTGATLAGSLGALSVRTDFSRTLAGQSMLAAPGAFALAQGVGLTGWTLSVQPGSVVWEMHLALVGSALNVLPGSPGAYNFSFAIEDLATLETGLLASWS